MQTVINVKPRLSLKKGGLKPDFLLYNPPTGAPVFIPPSSGASVYQITQTTVKNPDGSFMVPIVKNNRLALLQNTAFEIRVDAADPEKDDTRDSTDLVYRWKKNGAPLYAVNKLNDYKGVNILSFTEAQCTQEISGIYTLEASNSTGTTVAAELVVVVYNRLNTPNLYNNVIYNSSGESGLDGWETENGIAVSEFGKGSWEHENFASIFINPRLWTEKDANYLGDASTYLSAQPTKVFRFTNDINWINFYDYYQHIKSGIASSDERFNQSNIISNLIQNEDPYDEYACFFPSKKYVDEYNNNQGKIGLVQESKQTQTYFTKRPVEQGSPPEATMTQTIDITNLEDFVDGNTCGVSRVVGNFFSYVGLGMNGYRFIVKYKDLYNTGPGDWNLYDGIIRTTISRVANEATILYQSCSVLQYENGGIKRDYLGTPIGIANSKYAFSIGNVVGIHTNATAEKYSQRTEIVSKLLVTTIQNIPAAAKEGYTPPPWSYPILKDLFDDSALSSTFNSSNTGAPLSGQLYWGSFRRYFAKLFLVDSTTTTNKYLQGLGVINHPTVNTTNAVTCYTAVKTVLDSRMLAAETAIMETIVKPLNDKLFKLNLEADPNTYTEQQANHYNTLRALIHTVLSTDREKEIKSVFAIQVIKNLRTQETYNEARELQNGLFGEFNLPTQITQNVQTFSSATPDQWWQWAVRVAEWYSYRSVWGGDLNPQFQIAVPAGPDSELGTLILDWDELTSVASNANYTKKVDLDRAVSIQMIPRCHDKVKFEFTYLDAFGQTLQTDNLAGPTEIDLLAVKEKIYISTIINTLFNKFAKISQGTSIPLLINGYPAFNVVKQTSSKLTDQDTAPYSRKWLSKNINADFFTNLDNPNRIVFDKGVAAFFGVQKKLYIPQTTRSIIIKVTFDHESTAWGIEPDSGLYRYDSPEIPAEHTNFPYKFFRSGNPRVGLCQMKLCLYDNEFKRTSTYPNYYMPQKHIWQKEKSIIGGKLQKINAIYDGNSDGFVYVQATRNDMDVTLYDSPYGGKGVPTTKQTPPKVSKDVADTIQKLNKG